MRFGVVAIGRNEGERLRLGLKSLSLSNPEKVVYVDFSSTDGSAQWARTQGVEVVEQRPPFTPAAARNQGYERLREIAPDLKFVQFMDGDCEMIEGWAESAITFLEAHPDVAIVTGHRYERFPERSVFNWLLDRTWRGPIGEIRISGGDIMMRADVFEKIGGYRANAVVGEDNEICIRVRAGGWRIWRIDSDMTAHDAAMLRFAQWWKRTVRTGYGFAEVASLYGAPPERYFVWESWRAWIWGVLVPLVCLALTLILWPWGVLGWLIYPFQFVRQAIRIHGSLKDRFRGAFFDVLQRFPEALGQIKFLRNKVLGQHARLTGQHQLTDYKQ